VVHITTIQSGTSYSRTFQILSLDGGGIRGLFSAAVLAALEDDLNIRIEEHFDLIAGTSTGGIIALGLGVGLRPAEIVEFYKEHGPKIFHNGGMRKFTKPFEQVFRAAYSIKPLEHALQTVFGDRILADSTKRLIIPSSNLDEGDVYLFKTPHHERLRRDWKVPIWQIARATSAAPTYFAASQNVDNVRLIDGGLWANNPTVVAIIEANSMLGVSLNDIRIFNLGTMVSIQKRSHRLNAGGQAAWALNGGAEIILTLQSKCASGQAQHLIGKENIYCLNPTVPNNTFNLDTVDLRGLTAWAASQSRKFSQEFEQRFRTHHAAPYVPIYPNQEVRQ
jgi:uncharacterized protein